LQFRGIQKDYIKVLKGRKRPSFSPIQRNILTVPGKAGGFLQDSQTSVRQISVPVYIDGQNYYTLQKIKEDLAEWLVSEQAEELIFLDEPDRVYFALVDGEIDLDELVENGQGVITFICPDPYKYSHEKTVTNPTSFLVEGTAPTEPTIKVNIEADTTYLAVSDGEKMNLIGNPVKVEETPYEPQTPILIHSCNTLTGWTASSTTSIEASDLTGTLKTDGNDFYSDNFGTSPNWHGPAMKTSISQVLQDFRFDVGLSMVKTTSGQAGGIEVALLDANNKIVAKISLTKHFGGINTESVTVRAGTISNGHDVLTGADYPFDFNGVVRLYRSGNLWTAQVFYLKPDGTYLSPVTHSWVDVEGIAAGVVTQVQARLIQRASFPVTTMKISDINVYRLNNPGANQVPIIARAGDVIEFNHKDEVILKNGESILKEKAFIGEFFPLKQGLNTIVVEPAEAIQSVEVKWRDKWL
jgi:predicted phage tail component-like protein